MDFAEFAGLLILFSLCCKSAAVKPTTEISGDLEKWLMYSRALTDSLNSQAILNINDGILTKPSTEPCVEGKECTDGRSISEEAETPVSMLFLNLDNMEIPFPVVKDVLHLNKNYEDKGKFVSKRGVIFSFVNSTAIRDIETSGQANPDDDPMVMALFLPVEYRSNEGNKPLASAPKAPKLDTEWPIFFKTLLTEMASSNVTSQNMLQALMPNFGGVAPSYDETMRIIKDHNFPDTDVMLYYFRTPHVGIPPKYVKKVVTEANIPLASTSLSNFEVNEVYLMTVTNETAGKALKDHLESHLGADSPLTTPVVLSFIIPVDFKAAGRRALPTAKLVRSPPLLLGNPRFMPLALMPAHVPQAPFLVPIHDRVGSDPRIMDLIRRQYLDNLGAADRESLTRLIAAGSPSPADTVKHLQGSPRENPEGAQPRPAKPQPHASSGAYQYLSAPPATAPGGIASALQP